MKWIILIGDENFSLDSLCNIKHYGDNVLTLKSENSYQVVYGSDYITYDYFDNFKNEYQQEELTKIPFENPQFIMMVYNSKELMNKILSQDNFPKDIYVDDDRGNITTIEQFLLSPQTGL